MVFNFLQCAGPAETLGPIVMIDGTPMPTEGCPTAIELQSFTARAGDDQIVILILVIIVIVLAFGWYLEARGKRP